METLPDDANLELRRADAGDAIGLAEVARVALPLGGSEADFLAEIERQSAGGSAVWALADATREAPADAVRGGAVVRFAADEAELLWLAVRPELRRRGYGRRLLGEALAWAEARGATVFLEVRESNAAALGLYREAGFVVAGRRARYYRDGEDALLLRRGAPATAAGRAVDSQTSGEPR